MTRLRHALPALLICATCAAASAENASPLPAGQPAGTQKAALAGGNFLIFVGLAGVIAAAAILASEDNNKGVTTPTTTSTVGTTP